MSFSKRLPTKVIIKAQKGDKFALTTIYQEFKVPVFNLAYKVTLNTAASEDILQQVFEKVINKIIFLDNPSTFNGWIKTITYRASIDYINKKKLHVDLSLVESGNVDYEKLLFSINEESLDIEKYLKNLADRERVVLILFVVEGYSHREIGNLLDITEGNSKQIYKRLLAKLSKVSNLAGYSGKQKSL
ncbi:RNA polymerase sigma factor [Kangiella sp. HZ709]|uniref:RNA polymerase sigma factor n=1 Tax=Kangiella sp. HZ709 TaxID=2666328 RepID=UPI0012AF0ED7|nr:sigma-70 family RNA polymerase sigma factor [Kangiella sp. HZ709]MRX26679.1 sigma-70 family RNA polymerase sigma factor [Kangiella sp. HZ709]